MSSTAENETGQVDWMPVRLNLVTGRAKVTQLTGWASQNYHFWSFLWSKIYLFSGYSSWLLALSLRGIFMRSHHSKKSA